MTKLFFLLHCFQFFFFVVFSGAKFLSFCYLTVSVSHASQVNVNYCLVLFQLSKKMNYYFNHKVV